MLGCWNCSRPNIAPKGQILMVWMVFVSHWEEVIDSCMCPWPYLGFWDDRRSFFLEPAGKCAAPL